MNSVIFSIRLKKARERNNMSQADLAKLLGRSTQTISNWENQVNLPGLETFDKLCDILDISSDYLLGRNVSLTLPVDGLSDDIVLDLKKIIEYIKNK